MSVIESLHQARKARLKRMAARATPQAVASIAPRIAQTDTRTRPRERPDRDYERAWAAEIMGVVDGTPSPRRRPRIVDIQATTARHFGVRLADMLAEGRTSRITVPRHVAMYLVRELTLKSHSAIGRMFAGRDHSTVLYAIRGIEARLSDDPELADRVARIRAEFAEKPP
jgi:chromosomal replication initiation ATPase DnaA